MKATHSSEALQCITIAQRKSPKEVSDYYHFQISKNIKHSCKDIFFKTSMPSQGRINHFLSMYRILRFGCFVQVQKMRMERFNQLMFFKSQIM
jgi:hypothetical protein